MSSRNYLVCYDIREKKRLRAVHKIMKGYGDAYQYSVFSCDLTPLLRERLQTALHNAIEAEDQVLIIDLGPSNERQSTRFTTLGKRLANRPEGPIVI